MGQPCTTFVQGEQPQAGGTDQLLPRGLEDDLDAVARQPVRRRVQALDDPALVAVVLRGLAEGESVIKC